MRLPAALLTLLVMVSPLSAQTGAGQTGTSQPTPTFRAGVDRVGVTAVVRTRKGKPVTDLAQHDFELLDNGQPRTILEFRSEPTAANVGLLLDVSGSMNVAAKRSAAREVAGQILAWLTPGTDRVGLYAFDTQLHELQPLEPAPAEVLRRFDKIEPYGSTSLYDAIAEAGRLMASQGQSHRAVVALTDGGENSSRLTAAQVSSIASEIDVPVYIIVVVSPLDRAGVTDNEDRAALEALSTSHLGNLAHWTGGEIFLASSPAQTNVAARQIVTELRHQYFIGFAPDTSRPGWHPIDLRTRQKDLIVRARSGYVARFRPESQH
jgi:Ca-activated chloride channel family protein